MTSRHHECSLQFIENGNIPRTYHTQKGKEGGTVHLVPCHSGPSTEKQAWFSLQRVHAGRRCQQVPWSKGKWSPKPQLERALLRLAGDNGHLKLPRCFAPGRFVPLVACREAARSPALPREESTCPCLPCPAAQVNGSSRMYCMQKHPGDTAI